MVDYDKSTGNSGTMRIRDNGSTVELWLKAGSGTYSYQMPWGRTLNGGRIDYTFSFQPGGAWQKLGTWTITYSQTVTFHLGSTGTSGLGGPTNHSVFISRSTKPPAPNPVSFSQLTNNSVRCIWTENGNGGASILERRIGYGTSPSSPQSHVTSGGNTVVSSLAKGKRYYFWTQIRNVHGWSNYSARRDVTTHREPGAPNPVTFSELVQDSVRAKFTGTGNGGSSVTERQIGYGLSSSAPTNFVTSNNAVVSNLDPGRAYYFWGRERNYVGWGPWSVRKTAKLIAGAWVKDGGVWKEAVPYVRDAGVWKLARSWVRKSGVWKETQ